MVHLNENLALVRRMSLFWDPHMALSVISWMKEQKLLEPKSCDALSEFILPTDAESIARLLVLVIQQQGGDADHPEAQISDWENQCSLLEEVLSVYKRDQQKKIGGFADRKRLDEILEWYSEKEKPVDLSSECVFLPVKLGRIFFAKGEYRKALQHLDFYLNTVSDLTHEGSDLQTPVSCVWGICACILLLLNSENPQEDVERKEQEKDQELMQQLQEGEGSKSKAFGVIEAHGAARCLLKLAEIIDQSQSAASKAAGSINANNPLSTVFSREEQLQQRAWLLHWGMWLVYRFYLLMIYTKGHAPRNQAWSTLLDWLMQERNLTCVHLLCPHLLRYYAVYAILTRKRKDHFQSIIAAIGHTKNKYSDGFTSLLEALFLDFNFDKAQHHISSVSEICETDFFLHPLKVFVNEHSRLIIFETYCRIHKCINVDMIAKKVDMSPEAAERWIVNLIRHARLEARIDSEKNRVQISAAPPNLYQQVIEKTRNLCIRSNMLFQNLTRPGYIREDDVGVPRGGRGRGGRGRQWVQRGGSAMFMREGGGRGTGRGRREVNSMLGVMGDHISTRRNEDESFGNVRHI